MKLKKKEGWKRMNINRQLAGQLSWVRRELRNLNPPEEVIAPVKTTPPTINNNKTIPAINLKLFIISLFITLSIFTVFTLVSENTFDDFTFSSFWGKLSGQEITGAGIRVAPIESEIVPKIVPEEPVDDKLNNEPITTAMIQTSELGILAAPDLTSVILNATNINNNTNQNLTVYTNQDSNNSLKLIRNWKINGTSFAILNLPFENNTINVSNSTKDYSTYGNNGTVFGGTLWNSSGGYDGKGAYEFDGVNDYIDINNSPSVNLTNGITISLWLKANTLEIYDAVITKTSNGTWYDGYGMWYSNTSGINFFVNNFAGIGAGTANASSFTTGLWYHVVGTYDKAYVKLYLNGLLKSSSAFTANITTTTHNLEIGRGTSNLYNWNGTIDEVQIYNLSLSAEQILAIYKNKTELILSNETSAGQVWQACVTPNDISGDGAETCSNNLTVLVDNAPDTTLVRLNSSSLMNYTNESISCYANITDANGDNVYANFTWYNNTVSYLSGQSSAFNQNTFGLVATLGEGNTSRWQNWTCSVIAYDGTNYEPEWNNATLTIKNIPAAASNLVLNATNVNNNSDQNLTFYWSVADNESDSVRNITKWLFNGTAIAVLNMAFENNMANVSNNTKDYSGYGLNGTVTGAVWNSTGGYDGKGAYKFDGDNDKIQISDNDKLDFSNSSSFSVSAWFKLSSDMSIPLIVSKYVTGYQLMLNSGFGYNLRAAVGNDNNYVGTVTGLNDGNWHHAVMVVNWQSGVLQFYLDGSLDKTQALSSTSITNGANNSYDFIIGLGRDNAGDWNGSIDDVTIWNRSLSSQQVSALYYNSRDLIVKEEIFRGEVWQACVIPNDGYEDGSEVCSANLTVTNAPPTVASASVSTSSGNYYGGDLSYSYSLNDSDGDAANVTYVRWVRSSRSYPATPSGISYSNIALKMPFENYTSGRDNIYYLYFTDTFNDYSTTKRTFPTGVTWTGNVSYNATGGHDGYGAYEFNGSNDRILVYDSSTINFDNATSFTLMAWFKLKYSSMTTPHIFSKGNAYQFFVDSFGNLHRFRANVGNYNNYLGTTTNLNDSKWHHGVMVVNWQAGNISFYLDGVLDQTLVLNETSKANGANNSIDLQIGLSQISANNWNGSLDDIIIYSTALSASQISDYYNNKSDIVYSGETTMGEGWKVCLTPNDYELVGAEGCSTELTLANAPVSSSSSFASIADSGSAPAVTSESAPEAAPPAADSGSVYSPAEAAQFLSSQTETKFDELGTKIKFILENTGTKRILLFPQLLQEYDDPFFIITRKTLGSENSFFSQLSGMAYSQNTITGRLLKATLKNDEQIILEPGEKKETILELEEDLKIPRQIKIQFTTLGEVVTEKTVEQKAFSGTAIDLDTNNNLMDLYVVIVPVSEELEEYYAGNGNTPTGAAIAALQKSDEYFLEFTINNNGSSFGDIYGPYNINENQSLVFAQQVKYNPKDYSGINTIATKIYHSGKVIVEDKFEVDFGTGKPATKLSWLLFLLPLILLFGSLTGYFYTVYHHKLKMVTSKTKFKTNAKMDASQRKVFLTSLIETLNQSGRELKNITDHSSTHTTAAIKKKKYS